MQEERVFEDDPNDISSYIANRWCTPTLLTHEKINSMVAKKTLIYS